jgi:hypothetical protein
VHVRDGRGVVGQQAHGALGQHRAQVLVVDGHPPLGPLDVGQEVRHLRVRDQADDRGPAAERDHARVAAHPDDQLRTGVRVPDRVVLEVVHRDHRQREVVLAPQVERDLLVVQRVRHALDLGVRAQRLDRLGHLRQEVRVVVAEAQPGSVVRRVDQDRVLAYGGVGPAVDQLAGDRGRAGLEAHLVVQFGGQQCPDLLDRAVVTEPEEGRALDELAHAGVEARGPVGLAVKGVEADRVHHDRYVDAVQPLVRHVPLPAAVAVGRGVGDEQSAAADDQTAPGVDPLQRLLVEEPVGVDRVPAAIPGVLAEGEPYGLGQQLVARVALLGHVEGDVGELVLGRGLALGRHTGRTEPHQPVRAVGGVDHQPLGRVLLRGGVVVVDPGDLRQPGERGRRPVGRRGGQQQLGLGLLVP